MSSAHQPFEGMLTLASHYNKGRKLASYPFHPYFPTEAFMPSRYLLGIAILALVGLSIWAALADRLPGDYTIALWLQGIGTGWLGEPLRAIAWIGEDVMEACLGAAGMVLILRRSWLQALSLLAVAASGILVPILKHLVSRPRPPAELVRVLSREGGWGYPSGHAFLAVSVFGAMFCFANQLCGPNQRIVLLFRSVLVLAILSIGVSRIYLGLHWPSDVLGGYLLGGVALFLSIRFAERFVWPFYSTHVSLRRFVTSKFVGKRHS